MLIAKWSHHLKCVLLSCQVTQILSNTFPAFCSQTSISEQACTYCSVGMERNERVTVKSVPVPLDLCRESRELILCGT